MKTIYVEMNLEVLKQWNDKLQIEGQNTKQKVRIEIESIIKHFEKGD